MSEDIEGQTESAFRQGLALHRRGRLDQAERLYQQVLAAQPRHFHALYHLGLIASNSNRQEIAEQLLVSAIAVNPQSASAHNILGLTLCGQGKYEAAVASFDRAIALKADEASAYNNRGNAQRAVKKYQDAIASFDIAIQLMPDNGDLYNNRGIVLRETHQYAAAVRDFDKAIALKANNPLAYYNRGVALLDLKELGAAIGSFDHSIALGPRHPQAHYNRGIALAQKEQYEDAIASYDEAIALRADYAEAYNNRGNALRLVRKYEAAVADFDKAIELKPHSAEAYNNCGIALLALRRYEAAGERFERAIALNPDSPDAYNNQGMLHGETKQYSAAIECFERSIALNPACPEVYVNYGNMLRELKAFEAAVDCFDKALEHNPGLKFLWGLRLHAKMQTCDWREFEPQLAHLSAAIGRNEAVSPPFPVLAIIGAAELQKKAAQTWTREECPPSEALPVLRKRARGTKIRVGYFSPDFRDHAVSILIAELIETHDRSRVEPIAFSFGPDTQDVMRRRLEKAFDRFLDVRENSDRDIASMARTLEVDIAIDLAGFTRGSRPNIFAMRAAPLQVGYLGYLGTMAAPYIDYLIADRTIVPVVHQEHYAEKIIYLPSYQANDSKRLISDRLFTREELALPSGGFVFCCFNGNYKITPGIFDSWMRILRAVEGSVLFLYAGSDAVASNLRSEALKRGVGADQLVFGEKLPPPEYLARYRAADLFLDTMPYNAGTTASDALWAGLPVLTLAGNAFASRVAASLLQAVGLPELIATTIAEYEKMAIALAKNPERLANIKQKLANNRLTASLFDTRLFTEHLEAAYTSIYNRYQGNLAPEHIYL